MAALLTQARQMAGGGGMQGVSGPSALRKARRLHVSNLPADIGVTKESISAFFNSAMDMAQLAQSPGPCVVDVQYTLGKRFAFVEFRTPQEATAGMQLNGILFGPSALSIARPSDYVESSGPIVDTHAAFLHAAAASIGGGASRTLASLLPPLPPQPLRELPRVDLGAMVGNALSPSDATSLAAAAAAAAALTGTSSSASAAAAAAAASLVSAADASQVHAFVRKARRIYVTGIPTGLGITKEVVSKFFDAAMHSAELTTATGTCILDVQMPPDSKFAFLEFADPETATKALQLAGISFMGSPLKMSRPHDYMPLDAVQSLLSPAAAASASLSSPGVLSSAPVAVLKPSRYVALGNVVAPDELGNAEECSFVAEDTKAKFEADYGSVEHVFVVMSAKVPPLPIPHPPITRAIVLQLAHLDACSHVLTFDRLQEGCSSVAAMVVPGVVGQVVVAFHDMHAGSSWIVSVPVVDCGCVACC